MEPESSASKANRRSRSIRQQLTEFALAAAFVAAVFVGSKMAANESSSLINFIAVARCRFLH